MSSAVGWIDFDGEWRDRLAREGLRYFHMAEFADSVGDFEPLKKQQHRRRGLLTDLIGIICLSCLPEIRSHGEVEAVDAEFAEHNKLEYAPAALALAGEVACAQAIVCKRRRPSQAGVCVRGWRPGTRKTRRTSQRSDRRDADL